MTEKKKVGRPKKELPYTLEDIEKLAAMQCTREEIANFCGVSVSTLKRNFDPHNILNRYQQDQERFLTTSKTLLCVLDFFFCKEGPLVFLLLFYLIFFLMILESLFYMNYLYPLFNYFLI